MSIAQSSRRQAEQALVHERESLVLSNHDEKTPCFLCGDAIGDGPSIMWAGFGGPIWMHPKCALDLSVRLIRDYHEWDKDART